MTSILNEQSSQIAQGPWWVRLIYTVGVPACIAMYLVYSLVSGQAATISAMAKTVDTHAAISQVTLEELKTISNRQETYLRLLCANTSKTIADRNTCLTVR